MRIPGDITFFIFGTDIDLFSSLPHFVVPYCGDEDFYEVKTVFSTIVCMVLSNEIRALTRFVCIPSLSVTRVAFDVVHVCCFIIAYELDSFDFIRQIFACTL